MASSSSSSATATARVYCSAVCEQPMAGTSDFVPYDIRSKAFGNVDLEAIDDAVRQREAN